MTHIITLNFEDKLYDFILTEEEEESLETYYDYINDDSYGGYITIDLDDTIKNELCDSLLTNHDDNHTLTQDISGTAIP